MKVKDAPPRIGFRRHYYSKSQSFEQSLDVWEPAVIPKEGLPLVVFVIGSGWVGHRSIIYTGTSWWNSSGPKNFARIGCTCVCVRHRGAFPVLPRPRVILSTLAVVTAILASFDARAALAAAVAGSLLWLYLTLAARGGATFEEMLHDVSDAVAWVHANERTLRKRNTDSPLVIGGYSSGGHVAAAFLQRPDLLKSRNLPEKVCDAVIMVSGVLAVRPSSESSPPRWFTDLTLRAVFGEAAERVPSPLHGIPPRVPHLLIGCTREVFGIDWLDLFFCSRAFCEVLRGREVPVRFVEVDSDHWNILGSQKLRDALTEELGWISDAHRIVKHGACKVCQKQRCTKCLFLADTSHLRQE